MNHLQDQIIDKIVKDLKSTNDKNSNRDWLIKFNTLSRTKRRRIIKDLNLNYCASILTFVMEQDPEIHIHNIGTLCIKPSRKQYLDLIKSGVNKEEAVEIVKKSYRELNGKT